MPHPFLVLILFAPWLIYYTHKDIKDGHKLYKKLHNDYEKKKRLLNLK